MSGQERLDYEDRRKSEAHARREQSLYAQITRKNDLRALVDQNLREAGDQNLRPMFFHYYEYTGHFGVDKSTGNTYKVRTLKATSCLLIDRTSTEVRSKGLAIVSDLDNPSKLEGRNLALERALFALEEKATREPINRWDAKLITGLVDKEAAYMGNWTNKVVYSPDLGQLTQLEIERLDTWRTKRTGARTA